MTTVARARACLAGACAVLAVASGCTCGHKREGAGAGAGGPGAGDGDVGAAAEAACNCPAPPAAPRFTPQASEPAPLAPSARGLVVQLDAEPPTLMPSVHPEWTSWLVVAHLVDESLLRIDPIRGTVVPELAESWDVDATRTHWTFHLRKGVTWHDGVPFDADDVVFTFERLLDPAVGASDRALFVGARAVKTGPNEVELTLAAPLADPEHELDRLLVLPRHRSPRGDLARSPDATAPVGTGPMKFVTWARDQEIQLARNDAYWGPKAPVATLTFRFAEGGPGAAIGPIERGEIDVVPHAAPDLVERVESDAALKAKYDVVRAASPNYTVWIHNTRSPKLSDARVRRAIGLAVPRRSLSCGVEHCDVMIARGPLPDGHPALEGIAPPSYAPKRAAEELDAAGLVDKDHDGRRDGKDGAPFTLRLFYPTTARQQARIASVVAEELRRIGVTLDLVPLEWGQLLQKLESHDFDLAAMEWTIDNDPDLFPLYHSTQLVGALNYGGYADRDVDGWLEQLRAGGAPDASASPGKTELLHEVVARIRRDEPTTFLFSPMTLAIVRKGARNVVPTPVGWVPRDWGRSD